MFSYFLFRFRWVFCQLETLRHCLPPSVRGVLAELPETLDETYERILREIPKTNRVHAHRLLQCLTVAARPLKVEELAEVLAINFDAEGGIPKLNEGFRWADQEQAILSACSSLVAIVEYKISGSDLDWASDVDLDLRRVQFSHFSVKEFLTSDRLTTSTVDLLRGHHIRLEPAHTIMAKACLGVLLRLDDHMDKETILSYPLARYAGNCFVDHAKFGDVLSRINDELEDLFDPNKPHFNTWLWLQYGDWVSVGFEWKSRTELYPGKTLSDRSDLEHPVPIYPPQIFPLYYVLELGYTYLAQHLILKRPCDVDASDKFGTTALHIAAYLPSCKVTQMLIERAAAINCLDNKGRTPLHYAMRDVEFDRHDAQESLGDVFHCVRLLLDHGASADAQNNDGSTPLHLAASKMSQEIVQLLIENSANINLRNNQGQTVLNRASQRGHLGIIELILDHQADVDALDNDGSTPLHLAISDASLEAVHLLLKHGASVHLQNHMGQTALHKASQRGHLDIVRLLLDYGADLNLQDSHGSTPLHLATHHRSQQVVQLFLQHGANVILRNDKGQSALHEASQCSPSQPDIIQLILDHGADVDALDKDGSTPLHLASSEVSPASSGVIAISVARLHVEEASLEAVQLLLRHGTDINLQNYMGQTALHKASQSGRPGIMELILNHNADVDALDNDGSSPLHLAVSDASLEAVQILFKHGASVHLQNHMGQTALHKASQRGHLDIVRLLLDHGADLNLQDNHGSTSLHLATYGLSQEPGEVVQLLLQHGANVTLRNDKGQSALHKASQSGFSDVMQLILNHDAEVDALDNDDSTALYLAISEWSLPSSDWRERNLLVHPEGILTAVQLLLKHGANINLQNHMGQTALHKASQCGLLGIIELIVNHNVDVDARDNDGSTPLHLAIYEANLEVVQLLLEHGASVHTQNNQGETLFQAASARGLQEITDVLSMHIERKQTT